MKVLLLHFFSTYPVISNFFDKSMFLYFAGKKKKCDSAHQANWLVLVWKKKKVNKGLFFFWYCFSCSLEKTQTVGKKISAVWKRSCSETTTELREKLVQSVCLERFTTMSMVDESQVKPTNVSRRTYHVECEWAWTTSRCKDVVNEHYPNHV